MPAPRRGVLMLGEPVWGIAAMLMLATLIVLNVVRLQRSGTGRFPLLPVAAVVAAVLVVIGLVLAFGGR